MDEKRDVIRISPLMCNGVGKFGLVVWEWFYDSQLRSSWHRHCDFFEIMVCCSGTARHEDDFESIVLSAGDVLFLPPESVHRYTGIRSFRHYNVLFNTELLPFLASGGIPLKRLKDEFFASEGRVVRRTLSPEHLSNLVETLEDLRREMIGKREDRDAVLFAGVCRVLTYLQRYCVEEHSRGGSHAYQIGRAVQYIEHHVRSRLAVSEAAVFVGMSESNFRRHFLKFTGMSPMEYLQKLRFRQALLALSANMSVSEAAAQGGFGDASYFCRLFKARYGMTPLKFQRDALAGVIDPAKFSD